jgi:dTMP kinase
MPKRKGRLIVIEGSDGSGKATQFKKLVARLRREGHRIATFDFPQYDKPSSYFVREYLNGRYGGLGDVGPYRASVFYAVDRFDVAGKIRAWLASGRIVVMNRYATSNMGHQGAKIEGRKARLAYFRWLAEFEYGVMGIPRPDLVLVLHVPAAIAQKLVDKKGSREYVGGVKRDIHEANLAHLERAERTYLEMARMFPGEFELIGCVEGGRLLPVPRIHERIWKIVGKKLRI